MSSWLGEWVVVNRILFSQEDAPGGLPQVLIGGSRLVTQISIPFRLVNIAWPHRTACVIAICISAAAFSVAEMAIADQEKGGSGTVGLGRGVDGSYQWAVYARRDRGRDGGKRPCLSSRMLHREARVVNESDTTVCSALPSGGSYVVLNDSMGEGSRQFDVFGLAYGVHFAKVALNFGSRGVRTVQLHALSQQQSRKSGLRPFAYGAFSLRGGNCLEEVTGYNRLGEVIYQHALQECSATNS